MTDQTTACRPGGRHQARKPDGEIPYTCGGVIALAAPGDDDFSSYSEAHARCKGATAKVTFATDQIAGRAWLKAAVETEPALPGIRLREPPPIHRWGSEGSAGHGDRNCRSNRTPL